LYAGESDSVYQSVSKAQTFAIVGNQIGAGDYGAADSWTIRWNEGSTISVPGVNMHYGYLQLKPVYVKSVGLLIEATNTLSLHDQYLLGVSEVPSYWPAAALQAQVIASRTYALSRMTSIRKECDCNIYSSKYDQVYIGYSKESEPKYGALWSAAVAATDIDSLHALAITYNGAPINVYFFSSSGGATQLSKDVWGTAYPYLVSVPDPWSLDPTLNPGYAAWSRTVKQADMAAAFGLPNVARYLVSGRTLTGSALAVTAYSAAGVKAKISVSDFKTKLKLPSSWFDLPASVLVPLPTPTPTATDSTTSR
jgi:SpoIID/LytB domain protein